MRTLVLYVLHELNDNVRYFCSNAIFKHSDIDFMIIINNPELNISNIVPEYVSVINRENVGWDFGAWSYGLLTNNIYKNYDYFVFVNSSVIGPYLPPDISKEDWVGLFVEPIKTRVNNIRLFGSTINTIQDPVNKSHIQSYAYSCDKEILEFLINKGIFSITNYVKTYWDAIFQREIKMSRLVIENGWNIGSFLRWTRFANFCCKYDYNKLLYKYENISFNQYRNKLWNDYEVIFVKSK